MKKYSYNGPVLVWGTLYTDHFVAETMAPNEKKARSNLKFRYKKVHKLPIGSKVELPGKITETEA
mgnify:CR=1 FL=1